MKKILKLGLPTDSIVTNANNGTADKTFLSYGLRFVDSFAVGVFTGWPTSHRMEMYFSEL